MNQAQSPSSALRDWFDQAPRWLAERQLAQACDHALSLGLEIEAVRRSHTSSANRASQALDRFVCALRNARDVMVEPAQLEQLEQVDQALQAWQEPALALMANFQMQERAWTAGVLAGQDFMRGHEVLTQDTLAQLSRGLGLPQPAQTQARDPRRIVGLLDLDGTDAAGSTSRAEVSAPGMEHRPSAAVA